MKKQIIHKAKSALHRVKRKLAKNKTLAPNSIPIRYSIDNPTNSNIESRTIIVDGWIIPDTGVKIEGLEISHNGLRKKVPFGLKRIDVARAFPNNKSALHSGFSLETEVDNGTLIIEVDVGRGYQKIHSIDLTYSPEPLVADLYNPDLAKNWAEHLNLIQSKKQYYFEDAIDGTYSRHKDDPRLIAFYLPQFHPLPENDKTWGKGFTEWTNVTSDTPRFVGHNQPILPRDLGFYDLRLEQSIADQINLAKKHGIYGFCFYYYWFSGKRLLDQPLKNFLSHPEWDFNFAICWANENWTKRWDGRDNDVIIAQQYNEDDPLKFIKDIEHILIDPRYIREDNKPVLIVFRASELEQPENYARIWRDYFRTKYQTELHLVSIISFEDKDPRGYGFDAALDFAPQSTFFKNDCFPDNQYPYINVSNKLLDKNFSGAVADYRTVALNKKSYEYFKFPTYKCVTPSWDNDARKKGKGFIMFNESPDIYGQWLDNILSIETSGNDSPIIFINAWNEWAEGAILEPSMHYGSAILNRTTQVLSTYTEDKGKNNFPRYGISRVKHRKLAVIIHLYYPERWGVIKDKLEYLDPDSYDLFITASIKDPDVEEIVKKYKPDAHVYIVPNRGRDVLPFIYLASRLIHNGYEYILKIHSKKSTHRTDGAEWFQDVLDKLLPSKSIVNDALAELSKSGDPASIIGPAGHLVSLQRYMGGNETILKDLISKIFSEKVAKTVIKDSDHYSYFAGTMFWARLDALDHLLGLYLLPEDFQSEQNQIDGTMAHAVERVICVIAKIDGKIIKQISESGLQDTRATSGTKEYRHAP